MRSLLSSLWSHVFFLFLLGSGLAFGKSFEDEVVPFFKANCVKCHGAEKSKGKVTLHDLSAEFSDDEELELWELILEMIESGEMPPEDEKQPDDAEREAVAEWIESSLRERVTKGGDEPTEPLTRRLTNLEYENTLRDLLGFELKVIENLPKDPTKPYQFNNTADLMRIGPEQLDRYLETARRAIASAIVSPEKPEVHRTRTEWKSHGLHQGMAADELGIWGNRRNTPATGMGLKGFPETGEFRIRFKTSAILSQGVTEVPLRLVMGYSLNVNSATQRVETVGLTRLTNSPDHPEIVEFRGRIENFPVKPGRMKNGVRQPGSLSITPQILYNDGTLNDSGNSRNLAMPRAVIEWMEFEAPLTEVWPPEYHSRILFESPLREANPEQYVREVLTRFMSRAYRRPATQTEIDRFVKIYDLVFPELGTLEKAMRETLAMVLVSPQFLYHTVAEDDGSSRSYELASRLSYFLWGSMPDEKLLQLAASGDLGSAKVLTSEVERLLANEKSVDFVENFTMQWLSLAKLKTVPINRDLYPRFLYYVSRGERAGTEVPYLPTIRDYMVDESVAFVGELIKRNASVLNIVDSDFAMLNQPLAAHYGVEGVEGNELRPVSLKTDHRLGGLLTHGSILVANGTGSAPHPIYRAVWLREAILGDEVKPPPADVPALTDTVGESAENALTIKNLLVQHRTKESCMDCHVRLDPWGIPFEQYNAIGKYQAKVPKEGTRVRGFDRKQDQDLAGYHAYLDSISTEEIEADSRLPNGPEVSGMDDLKKHLMTNRKAEIAENVVRRLLTYGIGRELTVRDRFEVEQILKKLEKSQYPFKDMVTEVCLSPVFLGQASNKR